MDRHGYLNGSWIYPAFAPPDFGHKFFFIRKAEPDMMRGLMRRLRRGALLGEIYWSTFLLQLLLEGFVCPK
jgi:hypothetical protein